MFSKFHLQSKIINWFAASCFAVYLFHTHITLFYDYFKPTIVRLYASYDGIFCLLAIGAFLVGVFLFAILLDQPRKWIWNIISRKI